MDDTILNGDLHYALRKAGVPTGTVDMEKLPACVEGLGGIKNRLALQSTIKGLLASGTHVAITSFSEDLASIPYVLQQIGLSPQELAQIKIVSFYPSPADRAKDGKNNHIQRAIDAFGDPTVKPEEVVLVDDNINNYELAKKHGYNVIWVQGSEGRVDYLNELRQMAGLSGVAASVAPIRPPEESFVKKLLNSIGLTDILQGQAVR
ncbi:MAG: hypothetical protein SFT92_10085 [Rickettsiales bacterium]|nr:hypothetical protein [Rickettsiales bacterium]